MSSPSTKTHTPPEQDQLDLVFAALANQTRRALLARLGEAPAKITDLATPYVMSLPGVSKHLRVLEKAGLVQRDIEGRVHRCSLDTAPLRKAERWLEHYRTFSNETLEALAKHMEPSE